MYEMNSSIVHDNICSLIYEKCHTKNYNSDIKYHVTLNIIFNIAYEKPWDVNAYM